MRVALLGDVHANLPALEAVLAHAHQRDIEVIWNVGDFVGYGPFPDEVVRMLRREQAISIVGNYDLKVMAFIRKRKKWRRRKKLDKFLAFQWARANLSDESLRYLRSLPRERRLQVDGLRFLLTHGSPASNKEHLTPATPEKHLRDLARIADADVVICGHSHRGFVRRVGDVLFVNTGSVGRPDDGDPRACYAILQTKPGATALVPQVEHFRLMYDVDRAVAAIRESRLPEAFAQMLIQGRNLDAVVNEPGAWNVPTLDTSISQEMSEVHRLRAVLDLAERCDYEVKHARQVTRLALRLFDELRPLHRLGAEERFLLKCGALLHDVGWIEGQRGHHKTSLRLILEASQFPFDERERLIIGLIARYHRKALPKDKHEHFTDLSSVDQRVVSILAAMVRVADGLDRTHRGVVEDLRCELSSGEIIVWCATRGYAEAEREEALDKGELLERVFDRELFIEWGLA